MKPLLIVRPEPGCSASVAAARALGLEAVGAPLFAIEALAWPAPDGTFNAILAGSANAFRHGGPQLAALRRLPVLAVGEATAEAAEESGFVVRQVGAGGLQVLLDTLSPPCRLLRLAGTERVSLTLPAGIELTEREVYTAMPLPLACQPQEPCIVVLHSAAAVRHFASECERLALPRARFALACIGPRVAEAAGSGWAAIHCAPSPSDAALLALAADMCQTPA